MSAVLPEFPVPPARLGPHPHPRARVRSLPVGPAGLVGRDRRVALPAVPLARSPLPPPPRLRPVRRVQAAPPPPMPGPVLLGAHPPRRLDLPPAPPDFPHPPHALEAVIPPLPPFDQPAEAPAPTDADLEEALMPLVESAVGRALYAPDSGIHAFLEPLLRTTVRRALAELEGPEQAFGAAGVLDRLLWRLQALCSSRTYDEIVFAKTARHRIEAALLLGREALDLISYASIDPGCHAAPRRVRPLLREVLPRMRDRDGALHLSFDLGDDRGGVVREGRFTYLVAIVHGTLDEFAHADLDFIQRRIEERHGARLQDPTAPLLRRLQPMLEDCLLIRSPAAGG